jgi:hypothetical protein
MMTQSRCAIEVMRPVSARNSPGVLAGVENGGVVGEHTVGESVVPLLTVVQSGMISAAIVVDVGVVQAR